MPPYKETTLGQTKKVVRADKSPMNPKVTVFQLECGHDYYKSNHRGPYPKTMICEKCEAKR